MKIEDIANAKLPTEFGEFRIVAFKTKDTLSHAAIIKGVITGKENVLARIHSECLTGDVFHSLKCDCRQQLECALKMISIEKEGMVIYLRQEGRGIGLFNKIKAYELQDRGMDTVEANEKLGFKADQRDYSLAAEILKKLKVKSIILLTNNPEKIKGLEGMGIKVSGREKLVVDSNRFNEHYLKTKNKKMGHLI